MNERQEKSAIDPERSVLIAAIVFFLKAVGFAVGFVAAQIQALPLGARIAPSLLAAGMVAAGVGLLKWQRWAWPLALCVLLLDATLVREILRLLIDVGLLLLLVRPQVRSRFGTRLINVEADAAHVRQRDRPHAPGRLAFPQLLRRYAASTADARAAAKPIAALSRWIGCGCWNWHHLE